MKDPIYLKFKNLYTFFTGTPEERGMVAWKSELQGGDADDTGTEKSERARERLRKVNQTLYRVPFADKLLKKLPFLRFIPVYPR